jgi:hypothetical protein
LNIAGVDLLRSRRGPLVLEVNSSPGLEGHRVGEPASMLPTQSSSTSNAACGATSAWPESARGGIFL